MYRTKNLFLFLFLFLALTNTVYGQSDFHEEHEHHEHHRNEIGIANAPVYFIKEKVFAYGLHIHYIYNIPKTKFGLGLGYERIFDEHKHNTFGVVGSYRPTEGLSLNLSPGITFQGTEDSEILFAFHAETSYEFEINNFHIGPVLEFAYDPEDLHISLGLHVGYGF